MKFVYKHFDRGCTDLKTAQATECAGEQGKFWEMHGIIFDQGASEDVAVYASSIRIDKNKFSECLSSGKYLPRIQSDTAEARAKGISGTLGFLINNQLIVGAQPYDTFKKVIDVELNK